MVEQIEKFRDAVAKHDNRFKSLSITVVAYLKGEKWKNIGTELMLDAAPLEKSLWPVPEQLLNNLVVIKHRIWPNALASVLSSIKDGVLDLDLKIHYEDLNGNAFFSGFSQRLNKSQAALRYGLESGACVLPTDKEPINSLIGDVRDLDHRLESLSKPYSDFGDVISTFLSRRNWHNNQIRFVDIIAPFDVRLGDGSNIIDGVLSLEIICRCPIDKKLLSVGIIEQDGSRSLQRYTLQHTDFNIEDAEHGMIWSKKIETAEELEVRLKINDDVADQIKLTRAHAMAQTEANQRYAYYSKIDQELNRLQKYLSGEGNDKQNDFEAGVAILLWLCGFCSTPIGIMLPNVEAPDGLAVDHKSSYGLLYECTIASPDNKGKISKLVERLRDAQSCLGDNQWTAALFTSLEPDRISERDKDTNSKENIVLVTGADISGLLERVRSGTAVDDTVQYFKSLLIRDMIP